MKFEDFTKEERYVIAEYIYSYNSEILIKSDAKSLIDLMLKKEMILKEISIHLSEKVESQDFHVADEIISILSLFIDGEEGMKIMNEYYGK
jgi:hypothetical protein